MLQAISKALRSQMRDRPDEAKRLSTLYAQVGSLAPRLEAVHDTTQLLLQDAPQGSVPAAKWFTLDVVGDFVAIKAYASPVMPEITNVTIVSGVAIFWTREDDGFAGAVVDINVAA